MVHPRLLLTLALLAASLIAEAQSHIGIVRKNHYSSYFDSSISTQVDVLDSVTIRLGSVNPYTGKVSNIGNTAYKSAINLTGATADPYRNRYYISSGANLLTWDIASGQIINSVPITGPLPTAAFQNYRFNPSDSSIYGLVPENFYSSYFDSAVMSQVQVLDSSVIRFARINPATGVYTLVGNASLSNLYTLAGNSIDPHQMLFYYTGIDTLVSIDLYSGAVYSKKKLQLPPNSIFENFTYSCADTAIYGLCRRNFVRIVYDSLVGDSVSVIDSTTIKLARVNPASGAVNIISANTLALGASLNGSCFIDPSSMTYFFSTGNALVGVSLATGQITSNQATSFDDSAMYVDMMRSTQNCLGALRVRSNVTTGIMPNGRLQLDAVLFPNPAQGIVEVTTAAELEKVEVMDMNGRILLSSAAKRLDVSTLPTGLYVTRILAKNGQSTHVKLVKN